MLEHISLKGWAVPLGIASIALCVAGCSDDSGNKSDGKGSGNAGGAGNASTEPDGSAGEASTEGGAGSGKAETNPFVEVKAELIADAVMKKMADVSPSDKTITYNLVWDDPFFHTIRQGFQVAAQEIGFNATVVTVEPEWPPTGSLPDFEAEGADAYFSHWGGGVFVDNPDVPWVVVEPGTDVTPERYRAGLTSDNAQIAELLADLVVDALGDEEATVAVYGAGDGPGNARGKRVASLLEDAGYTVVGTPTTADADDADKILVQMDADFEAHPDIKGVVGTLGFHGGSIGAWLQENDYDAGEVAVVCTDFEAEVQDLLDQEYVSATIIQRQYWWGYIGAYVAYAATSLSDSALLQILGPHADENGVISTDFDTVTPENREAYLGFLAEIGVLE